MDCQLIATEMPSLLPSIVRSPGIHVSDIIASLCRYQGIFGSGDDIDLSDAWANLGAAWEYALTQMYHRQFPDRYVSLGELCHDGIYCTPDLYDTWEDRQKEIKSAWMSSKHEPADPKLWRYLAQLKAYCYVNDTPRGNLEVVFVNGDYKKRSPDYRSWDFTFTNRELTDNWRMLIAHTQTAYWEESRYGR